MNVSSAQGLPGELAIIAGPDGSKRLVLGKMAYRNHRAGVMGPAREGAARGTGGLRIGIGPVAPVRPLDLCRAVPGIPGDRQPPRPIFSDDSAMSRRVPGQGTAGEGEGPWQGNSGPNRLDQPLCQERRQCLGEGRDMMGQGGFLPLPLPMRELRLGREVPGIRETGLALAARPADMIEMEMREDDACDHRSIQAGHRELGVELTTQPIEIEARLGADSGIDQRDGPAVNQGVNRKARLEQAIGCPALPRRSVEFVRVRGEGVAEIRWRRSRISQRDERRIAKLKFTHRRIASSPPAASMR